jgi:hypothetical protein
VANLTALTYLSVTGLNTIGGSVANLTALTLLNVTGSNTLSGSVENLTALTYLSVHGSNTTSGNVSLLTNLQWLTVSGQSTITVPNVTNLTSLCQITLSAIVLTSANVNQLLADFWANRNAPKPRTERTINLSGKSGSGAPTGQGLIDKTNLQSYKSPNDTYSTVWNVTTR